MILATAVHNSTTLASFETARWAYAVLAIGYIALIIRGNLATKLGLFIGAFMGILLPAFLPAVSRWTAGVPSKRLGSGTGLLVTIILVIVVVLGAVLFYLEHTRAAREGKEAA